ncbi:phosphate-import protein PhnD precursor [bacterium BMS3Abin03]|nr:phosphate-import protein PhnD precursor [bacterium BMS3Abin03]
MLMKQSFCLVVFAVIILLIGCKDPNHYGNKEPVKLNLATSEKNSQDKAQNIYNRTVYVAISTMISPKETFSLYENLLKYIEKKLGIPIKLKQRKTYQEVNNLLKDGDLDFAYICSGAFVVARKEFPLKILAAPEIRGKPYYQAYIIVNKNSNISSFDELKGKTFAFTDPLSNTGYKFAIKLLNQIHSKPDQYFSKTIFTYAHDYSIQAVERGLVDGAAIDGLVYEYLKVNHPQRITNIKIIKKSEWFGIPPFVYTRNSNQEIIKKIQNILLNMHLDNKGKSILKDLQIDKFVLVDPSIYKSIESFN